jgi:hypothetical protein
MRSFSQRKGFKPVAEVIQIDSMNGELRNCLWNCLEVNVWSQRGFVSSTVSRGPGEIDRFSFYLWDGYFKLPVDTRPHYTKILDEIRKYFFGCQWNEAYDFLEFVVHVRAKATPDLAYYLNSVLERELSGYRFVASMVTDITGAQETEALQEALRDSRFAGASRHLQRALELYADRKNPDYRNSVKESISAVESIARIVSGKEKAVLSDALKIIEKNGALHASLKEGFLRLYGYTSDKDGIRHAMLEEPDLTQADARYFLVACSAFVNYLKAKLPAR